MKLDYDGMIRVFIFYWLGSLIINLIIAFGMWEFWIYDDLLKYLRWNFIGSIVAISIHQYFNTEFESIEEERKK